MLLYFTQSLLAFFIADAKVTCQYGYGNLTHAFFSLGTQCY